MPRHHEWEETAEADYEIGVPDFVQSIYRVWQRIAVSMERSEPPPLSDVSDIEQAAWGQACIEMMNCLRDPPEHVGTRDLLAKRCHECFMSVFRDAGADDMEKWDAVDNNIREAWRTLVRHGQNLVIYDPEEHGGLDTQEEMIALQFTAVIANQPYHLPRELVDSKQSYPEGETDGSTKTDAETNAQANAADPVV